MLESDLRLKKIYILLACGGAFVFITESLNIFVDPFSWLGWWWGNVFHIFGGIYAFFFARELWLYAKSFHKMEIPLPIEIMIWAGGALIIGVFWEWYELIVDRYEVWILGAISFMTYADNIGDLMFDALGGILAGIYFWKHRSNF